MHRKKNSSIGDESQMNLPFENNDTSIKEETAQDNLVYLSLKIEENDSRDEKEARQKSINRLLNYAETLDW